MFVIGSGTGDLGIGPGSRFLGIQRKHFLKQSPFVGPFCLQTRTSLNASRLISFTNAPNQLMTFAEAHLEFAPEL